MLNWLRIWLIHRLGGYTKTDLVEYCINVYNTVRNLPSIEEVTHENH